MGASRNWLLAGATAFALSMAIPTSAQVIYQENFEAGGTLQDRGFTVYDIGSTPEVPVAPAWALVGPAVAPRSSTSTAYIGFDATNPLDDYLITPALALESGKPYKIYYTVTGGGNAVIDEMDVYMIQAPIPSQDDAIDIVLFGEEIASYDFFDLTELTTATTPRFEEIDFVASSTGNHHIAFHARSLADQNYIWIDDILVYDPSGPPIPSGVAFPASGATNVNQQTFVHVEANPTADSYTVYFSSNQADVIAGTAPKILDNVSGVFFADPGALTANTTYYVRADATNTNGTTPGAVSSFTTRPAATAAGQIYFTENFDTLYYNPPTPGSNFGYPDLPKAWDTLDVDGALSAIGVPIGWYVSDNRSQSLPNGVQTRRNTDGPPNTANDDWLFFPEIATHPSLESVLDFAMRTRIEIVDETPTNDTVEVYWSTTGTNSTTPGDYVLQDTIVTSSVAYLTYRYNLPKGQNVRFALRYISPDRSQVIVDDVVAQILSPPPAFSLIGPPNGATDVNLVTWLASPSALDVTGLQLYFGTNQTDVANKAVAPLSPVVSGGWYFDPGTLAPSTTYYALLRTTNAFGSVDGPVTSFTTRAAVTAEGGTFFFDNLDPHPFSIPNTAVNLGYPTLPKGWDAFDGDGLTTRAGQVVPFYVFASPTASQNFTTPNALWSRGSAAGQSDDWVFFPPVQTHPTLDTVLRFYARGGDSSIDEVADIRYSTNTSSSDPADYTNLIDTLLIPGPDFLTFQLREYVLPKGQNIRVAINCYSSFGSRFILDDFSISILSVPDPQSIVTPANGATNVNQVTYLYLPQDVETDSYTVYFGTNQTDVTNMTVTPILEDSTDVFFADPGTLAPNTTYYTRLVATNEFGDSPGPVTSFTTRANPTAGGQAYFVENFDARHLHPRSGTDLNIGYPELPKGWETVDVDGFTNRAGIMSGFYIENGSSTQNRSQPNSLWSRGTASQMTNDWVFMPPITTHPSLDTVVRIWARGGDSTLAEIGDVKYGTNPTSINPADYPNLLGTISIPAGPGFSTYIAYDYLLPKNQTVRVAINCYSFNASRFILDDISIFVSSPPPALSILTPANGATEIAGAAQYFYLPTSPDVSSYTIYLSQNETEVVNKSIAPLVSNFSGQNYVDPGTLAPGATYYVRLVTNNDSGSTDGPVTSFSTLATPTNVGDRYFIEGFNALHLLPRSTTPVNPGYPDLPKGWQTVDVDDLLTLANIRTGFYVENGSSTQDRSQPHSLWARGINAGTNNDWVFLPPITTHPTHDTVIRIWARGGASGFVEIGDIRTSSNTNSIDPADYTNLLGTIETSPAPSTQPPPNFSTYEAYEFVLPKGEDVRVAINCRSFDASRFILDDIEIFLAEASVAIPGDFNNDGVINVADVTALALFLNGNGSVTGDPDFNGDESFDEQDVLDLADSIVN